jgi:hypothetical protein
MSTYNLYYQAAASVAVTVEADSLDDAIELGYDELPGGLCHQCAGHYDIGDLQFDDGGHEVDGKFVGA